MRDSDTIRACPFDFDEITSDIVQAWETRHETFTWIVEPTSEVLSSDTTDIKVEVSAVVLLITKAGTVYTVLMSWSIYDQDFGLVMVTHKGRDVTGNHPDEQWLEGIRDAESTEGDTMSYQVEERMKECIREAILRAQADAQASAAY